MKTTTRPCLVRLARAAALVTILAPAAMAPAPAEAQLGSLVVTVTSPQAGATVTGTTTVQASTSPLGIVVLGVQFRVDGANVGGEDTSAPYSVPWNTVPLSNGSHTLTAVARSLLGLQVTSNPVTVTVLNDTTPPTVTVTSPGSGATVSGTITVSASASDNVGVAGVRFRLDGAPLGGEDVSAPYSVSWNTSTAGGGAHTLSAVARDAAGHTTTSASVAVTVTIPDTTPPSVSVTSPGSGATVSGTITVSASASDNVGVAGVQFRLDDAPLDGEDVSAPYSVSWNTSTAGGGAHTLSAVARDAAGNTTASAPVSVSVSVPDSTPPTVAVTSPASGATVSGTVTVSASASDNVGVAGVQFRLDGAALGAEDASAPYAVGWDTTTASAGTHTLSAVARDAAGNTATSASVTVVVANAGGGFVKGDVFVAIVDGRVQWRGSDGLLKGIITGPSDGQVSSVAFDATGKLYVPHWWGKVPPTPGNTVDRYDGAGNRLGTFGTGYDCNPSSLAFNAAGNVYVGQADCTGDVLKFSPTGTLLASFNVAVGNRGTDHIDLAADGCTIVYASRTQDILQYDACANVQRPPFNVQPLPGEAAYHLRVLPDGGVLVADSHVVVRLDASGNQVQSYGVAGEPNYWGGLDLVGDGTFWATNAANGNVYRFNLQSGAVLAGFNTGTGNFTVAGVAVKP